MPRPFSKVYMLTNPARTVPAELSSGELEQIRQSFEDELNALTDEAERLAEGATPRGESSSPAGRSFPDSGPCQGTLDPPGSKTRPAA